MNADIINIDNPVFDGKSVDDIVIDKDKDYFRENESHSNKNNNDNNKVVNIVNYNNNINNNNPQIPDGYPYQNRELWSDQADFIFNTIGYVVGLGNFWKFPHYIVKYGGSFFIPYTFFFLLFGIPTFLFEMYIGQFTSRGAILSWGQCKLLRGIGLVFVVKNIIEIPSYLMIIAWAFKYLGLSFNPQKYFFSVTPNQNGTMRMQTYFESEGFGIGQVTDGLQNFGLPKWELVISSIISWTILFLCVMRGLKYSGKIVYATVLIPSFLLWTLLTHVLTLKGSNTGINKYFNQIKLTNTQMWIDAASQTLFSLSLASSGINTLSSYRNFKDELIGTASLICFIDYLTSVIASLIITGFLGNLEYASKYTTNLQNLSGFDLLFVVVPQAILDHDISMSILWLLILFTTILTLGFDTAITKFRIIICGCFELFGYPKQEKSIFYYLAFSIVGFIFCIPICCPGGLYWSQQIGYGLSWCFMLMELLIMILIIIFYGFRNVYHDIAYLCEENPMTAKIWNYLGWYFIICWSFVVPIIFLVLFIASLASYSFYSIPNITVPAWMNFFELFFPLFLIFTYLVYCLFYIIKSKHPSIKLKLKTLIATDKSKPLWYPALENDLNKLIAFKNLKPQGNIIDPIDFVVNNDYPSISNDA